MYPPDQMKKLMSEDELRMCCIGADQVLGPLASGAPEALLCLNKPVQPVVSLLLTEGLDPKTASKAWAWDYGSCCGGQCWDE